MRQYALAGFAHGQHDIREGESPTTREAGLENGLRSGQQLGAGGERGVVSVALRIQQAAFARRVIQPARNFPDLVPDREASFCAGRVLAQLGVMNLKPEPLGALAIREKL